MRHCAAHLARQHDYDQIFHGITLGTFGILGAANFGPARLATDCILTFTGCTALILGIPAGCNGFISGRGIPTWAKRGLRRRKLPGELTVEGLERKLGISL